VYLLMEPLLKIRSGVSACQGLRPHRIMRTKNFLDMFSFFELITLLKDLKSSFEMYPEEKSLFLPLILKVAGGVRSGNPVQKLRARISLNGG
jgi:hypothetical protein